MNSVDDTMSSIMGQAVAAINMTGEIIRYTLHEFGEIYEQTDSSDTLFTWSSSYEDERFEDQHQQHHQQQQRSDRSVKRSRRRRSTTIVEEPEGLQWLFGFLALDDISLQSSPQRNRGRSLRRRRNTGIPTNAARPAPIQKLASLTPPPPQRLLLLPPPPTPTPQNYRRMTHDDVIIGDESLDQIETEQGKREVFRPATIRRRRYWLRRLWGCRRRHVVYLIEPVNTFDMIEELALGSRIEGTGSVYYF